MPSDFTTVSIRPSRASRLREFRDEHDLPSIDAAVDELLNQRRERSH